MDNSSIIKLLNKLKIKYKDLNYYIRAFTHSSYANENKTKSNERYEFLGDAVLDLFISELLINNYKLPEGDMTKKRAQLVCEDALYKYSKVLELDNNLLLGKGEMQKGATKSEISDLFEAFLAAIYLDLGIDSAKSFFEEFVIPNLDLASNIKDYKTQLQELVQSDKRTLSYHLILEDGPSHDKYFETIVMLDNKIILGKGSGKSKKESEQNAAKDAILKGEIL